MSVLKEFIQKHMKTDAVIVCPELNEKIWENGIKNPPGKVSVIALKTQIGGKEKTLVNLLDVGVDKYVEQYKSLEVAPQEEVEEVKEEVKAETKEEVKEEKKEADEK